MAQPMYTGYHITMQFALFPQKTTVLDCTVQLQAYFHYLRCIRRQWVRLVGTPLRDVAYGAIGLLNEVNASISIIN